MSKNEKRTSKAHQIDWKELPVLEWRQWEGKNSSYTVEIVDCACKPVTMWTYEKVFNATWQIYCTLGAKTWISYKDKRYWMTPRQVFLVPSNMPFSTGMIHSGPFFSIVFRGCNALESLRRNIYPMNSDYLKEVLPSLFHCRYPEKRLLLIQSIVFHYLAELPKGNFISSYQELDPRIFRAIEIIESELSGDCLLMKDISRRLRMSQNFFQRLFLREVKKTPKQFVNDLRIQRAANWLKHTDKNLDDIASELGFSDRYQFSKFFRKQTNSPPIAFRKAFRMSKNHPSR